MIEPYSPPQSSSWRRNTGMVWTALLVLGAVFLGKQIIAGGPLVRVIVAVVAAGVLIIPAIERPRAAIMGLFILLPFLGAIRHMFLASTGPATLDPLLLVTSAVAFTVFISLTLNHQMDFGGTPLAKVVFFLLLIGLVQVFNPGQAGQYSAALLIGLTGIMLNLIPISFFFIARSISDAEMTHRVVRLILVIGALAAAYGLFQVFFGFRGFEKSFLATQGFTAITVGQTTRPFSFFNNPSEYAAYIQFAFVAAFATLLFAQRTKRTLMIAVACLVAYAGFLTGSRGFTVKIGLAVIILLAARAKNRLLAAGIVVMLVSGLIAFSANTTSTSTIQEKKKGPAQLIEQQVRALADPFDRAKSTLPVHFDQAATGISYALTKQPFGLGTGVATRGGSKFGGLQAGTELDIGDVFLSLGAPGGFLYIAAIVLALVQAGRVRRALPGPVWIGIWAVALTSVGAWLNGGNYAVTPLIWFLIGAADGEYKRLRDRKLLSRDDGRYPAAATLPA